MTPSPKKRVLVTASLLLFLTLILVFNFISFTAKPRAVSNQHIACTPQKHTCVMKTIFGLDTASIKHKSFNELELSSEVKTSITHALSWISQAQLSDGGWGAGYHSRQDIRDPHAVSSDPATTSLVALSLLRTGNSLESGQHKEHLLKATTFLLNAVEQWSANQPRLTLLTGTQPQQKLGDNIDAILTVQYFTTLLKYHRNHSLKPRIETALQKCVSRIEKEQDTDGGWKGGGWAPVLQSALADLALESANDEGIKVDTAILSKSKYYQKSNFDTATKSAITGKAAGITLYALSGTSRSSAKEANKAKLMIDKAKKDGKLKSEDALNEVNLMKAGASPSEAKQMVTANMIHENTKTQSAQQDVMEGFGSNGGEELISYLMTGESMLMQGGNEWKKWYKSMSAKILSIQKGDGSWEGHHCITSPVFCTATALLILSIHDDMTPGTQNQF